MSKSLDKFYLHLHKVTFAILKEISHYSVLDTQLDNVLDSLDNGLHRLNILSSSRASSTIGPLQQNSGSVHLLLTKLFSLCHKQQNNVLTVYEGLQFCQSEVIRYSEEVMSMQGELDFGSDPLSFYDSVMHSRTLDRPYSLSDMFELLEVIKKVIVDAVSRRMIVVSIVTDIQIPHSGSLDFFDKDKVSLFLSDIPDFLENLRSQRAKYSKISDTLDNPFFRSVLFKVTSRSISDIFAEE